MNFVMASPNVGLPIKIQFRGGLELLFDNKNEYVENLFSEKEWTLKELILWLQKNRLRERDELFIQNDSVRPGILVLVNDSDWELHGQGEYKLRPNDTIVFISTLHGG